MMLHMVFTLPSIMLHTIAARQPRTCVQKELRLLTISIKLLTRFFFKMAVYYINSYDIVNPDEFKSYPPKVLALLQKYGAEVIASDTEAIALEGKAKTMNAIVKFPSAEAALECYNDPEYHSIKEIRLRSTANGTMILVKAFNKQG